MSFTSKIIKTKKPQPPLLLSVSPFHRHGFIIAVQKVIDISDGRILPGRAHALYVIKYKALVFRPFVGEVVDAIVSGVIEVRRERERKRFRERLRDE